MFIGGAYKWSKHQSYISHDAPLPNTPTHKHLAFFIISPPALQMLWLLFQLEPRKRWQHYHSIFSCSCSCKAKHGSGWVNRSPCVTITNWSCIELISRLNRAVFLFDWNAFCFAKQLTWWSSADVLLCFPIISYFQMKSLEFQSKRWISHA